jgi:phospholipid/cholesterol/gamma-HCH transport system ATP-binding protein
MATLEYNDVYKAFDAPVLAGVSFTVSDRERLAVVGPSGTGKSVLLKMAIGLIVPDAGDVLIDGDSVVFADRRTLERIRCKVGYVFQNAALFDSMTILENVAQGLHDETLRALGADEVLGRVSRALEDVNLEPEAILGKLPSELSGGMRKRVGLARALVGSPEIILYDEPVTGLDPVNTAAVGHLIAKIADRRGATTVLVTHEVAQATELADRIALLSHGRLVFLGTPAEFKASDDELVRAFAHREAAAQAAWHLMEEE